VKVEAVSNPSFVVLEDHEISCVINVSRSRAPDTNDADYASRRAAVDFGIPVSQHWFSSVFQCLSSRVTQLINNAKLAVLFTETLQKKFHNSPLPYVEGTNPPEVKVSKDDVLATDMWS
jgi:carbamoyl-phosphate synthase large subunit